MIRLVVCNQKGGVSKTTTTLCMARCFAEKGLKVLLIDTDSQGSLATSLGVKFTNCLYHFLVNYFAQRPADDENGLHVVSVKLPWQQPIHRHRPLIERAIPPMSAAAAKPIPLALQPETPPSPVQPAPSGTFHQWSTGTRT